MKKGLHLRLRGKVHLAMVGRKGRKSLSDKKDRRRRKGDEMSRQEWKNTGEVLNPCEYLVENSVQ